MKEFHPHELSVSLGNCVMKLYIETGRSEAPVEKIEASAIIGPPYSTIHYPFQVQCLV